MRIAHKISPEKTGIILTIIGLGWFVLVSTQGILAGYGLTFITTNFGPSGAFGDSFGPLGAFMAAIAAIGAWQTVLDQRKTLEITRSQETSLAAEVAKRDFESTFFNLMRTFERIVAQIDVGTVFSRKTGKDSFRLFAKQVRKGKQINDYNFSNSYSFVFIRHESDLAHYFRTLFNIVKFVDQSKSIDRYLYLKLLRATLSEQELVLLALNGLYHDEGRLQFKPLIEKYALLNNISAAARADFDLSGVPDAYEEGAFKFLGLQNGGIV